MHQPEEPPLPDHLAGLTRLVASGEASRALGVAQTSIHNMIAKRELRPSAYFGPVELRGGRVRVGGFLFTPQEVERVRLARSGRQPYQKRFLFEFLGGRAAQNRSSGGER